MIKKLYNDQVLDPARGLFFVHVKPTQEHHRGLRVYEAKPDHRFVILDAAQED